MSRFCGCWNVQRGGIIAMGAKMSRRNGRRAATATRDDEMQTGGTELDRVASSGRVDAKPEVPGPDLPVVEQNLNEISFENSDNPADLVLESPPVNDISLNNCLDMTAADSISEPPADVNFSLQVVTTTFEEVVPMPDPPIEEQNLINDDLEISEKSVDPASEPPKTDGDSNTLSIPTAAVVSTVEPPADLNSCKIEISLSDDNPEPLPEHTELNLEIISSKILDDPGQCSHSVSVEIPPEVVPEPPPNPKSDTTYFWCYVCQNSGTNTLPWLLRLKYSKPAMCLKYLFTGSMFCIALGLLVIV
ncbi:uncharacterized protein LOC128093226 [Culex pipiens pallens]|uniref:uncharacterized protein LOC128093226 n=1 Tax=Culex pipiens pallens TaxID=42434 RepID=UPI0022AA897E|nr:uncharacterized protein LOC128093226 [Culex pipiens pallens]